MPRSACSGSAAEVAREINHGEQQIADLVGDTRRRRIAVGQFRLDLVDLLAELGEDGPGVVPVEADGRRLLLKLQGAGERRQAARDAVRDSGGRVGATALRTPGSLFLRLDLLPDALGGARGPGIGVAEDVGVPPDELGVIASTTSGKANAPILGHTGVIDHLEQQVAEFVTKIAQVVPGDRLGDLVRFLDRVGRNRREVLLDVPGTAGHRITQRRHDLDQPADVARGLHAERLSARGLR